MPVRRSSQRRRRTSNITLWSRMGKSVMLVGEVKPFDSKLKRQHAVPRSSFHLDECASPYRHCPLPSHRSSPILRKGGPILPSCIKQIHSCDKGTTFTRLIHINFPLTHIYTDIYIRALDATLPEEEPTGIDDLEGVKAYAKDGSIYVYTPNREEVTIIGMTGAIIKNEEQVGLQSYLVSRGIYIVRIGEKVFKLKN